MKAMVILCLCAFFKDGIFECLSQKTDQTEVLEFAVRVNKYCYSSHRDPIVCDSLKLCRKENNTEEWKKINPDHFVVGVMILFIMIMCAWKLLKIIFEKGRDLLFNPKKAESSIDQKADLNTEDNGLCAICKENYRKCAPQCGHYSFCFSCSNKLDECPICRRPIREIIRIYA